MKETIHPEFEIDFNQPSGQEEEFYIFPATFAQKRFWFLDQFEPGSPYYNIPSAFRLRGRFDVAVFKRAIDTIVSRHEILRTTFDNQDGQPVQVVSDRLRIGVPLIDISNQAGPTREREIQRLAREEARRPFDLNKGPLVRVSIIRVAETDHVVLLTMHHIISDGWSMGVLIREITLLYNAYRQGQPNPLEELPIQYGDFAEWQMEYLQGEVVREQLEYWKEHLGSHPPVLELPYDRPRPAVWSNVGSSVSTTLSKEITDRLNRLSREEGATLFMTLLTAFKILLYRYSGHTDMCIGTPIANRNRSEIEGLIGLFINTLVIRSRFDDLPSFRELLRRIRSITLSAYDHQDLPFEYLVDALQPDRDMTYPPLFQVMFILQNTPVQSQPVSTDLTMEMLDVDMGTATFDMTLSMSEGPQGMSAAIEYNTDLFDRRTIEQFLDHFKNLLASIVRRPDECIARLPILSAAEENRILYQWNDTAQAREENIAIHHLFERRVEENPAQIAVVCRDESITYETLNIRANQLARYLEHFNIYPDTKVAILADKSIDLMVAVLGVLKSGAAYLPLDPDYPEERLQYMLEDGQVKVLITREKYQTLSLNFSGPVVFLDRDWEQIAREASTNPLKTIPEDQLAYLIYTSGSTGKAKGTMISHRSLVNAYLAWEEAYELRTRARNHLQMASFSFDVFSGDWTRALCSGGKMVMVPRDMLLEAEELYTYMRREEVNIAEFVPAVLRNLIQYLEQTGQKLDFFRSLIAGSDIWYVGEYQKFKKFIGPETRLINSFGLTEATIDSTFFESDVLNMAQERLVPIGRPFRNMTVYILDEALQVVPVGVHGELYVGGLGLARGYWQRPDLTAERFIPHPYAGKAGERLYRTGDRARYLPDGNIEFLGRADTQVKLRGFRIELGEIETTLSEYPEIKDAAVALREDSPGDKRLVAYYVPKNGQDLTSSALKEFLAGYLPEYMIPSAFVRLKALPLTPNGKVDRRALPKPDQSLFLREMEEEYVPPRTPTEEVIAAVFSQILNVEKVGAFHNFFMLGGHSLLATQLISRLRDNFQADVPLRSVFENPTVAGLALAVDKVRLSSTGLQAPPILPGSRDQDLPLSFAQQRLWFLDQLEPNSPFYNIPETYMIEGALKPDVLEKSINEVIRRHESLRTTFHKIDGQPAQTIHEHFTIALKVRDFSHLSDAEKSPTALRIARESALTPISISELPLFNLQILRFSPTEHAIILVIHHIISDNWSTQIMMAEISTLYDAFARLEPSPLPDLPIQYADFAHWQRNWLQGEVLEQELNYWKDQLKGSPPLLELPTDRPRPPVQTFNGAYGTFYLSEEASRGIHDLAKNSGATVFMTLLAAFKVLLFRYSGQEDIVIGTPIANRNRSEIEGLIGFFVNTLVMRTDLSGNPSFIELLRRLREIALGAYAHQDVPFEKIVDALQPERNLSHSPLFQVMFALQSAQAQSTLQRGYSDLMVKPIEAHSATSKFDLTLFMIEDNERIGGAFEYNTDLFDDATIDRMISHFTNLIDDICRDARKPITLLNLISESEKQQLLKKSLGRKIAPLMPGTIVEFFEHQVLATPHHIALQWQNQTWTYAELNGQVNRWTHFLINKEIQAETLVGIFMRRSPQMIVALLAVLKAGAAYVPIDPHYPEERIRYIIEDAGLSYILTQKELKERLASAPGLLIAMDEQDEFLAHLPETNPARPIDGEQLAYMIYTSGSTGKPKGSMIHHRGLSNYLQWCKEAYPLDKGRGSLVHSTIAFDATITAIYSPLISGKTTVLLDTEDDPEALSKALIGYGDFSLIKITPAHLELLGHQIPADQAAKLSHAFVIGGENLTAEQIEFWQREAPDALLFNEYGPTETVVGCIVYEAAKWRGKGSVPIGTPISNSSAYLLDAQMQPVPVGVPGELYIGGEGVARGYWNRPDLTAERFVPNPFSLPGNEGERLYRSGDRVRWLPDGNMEFMGRIDEQIKIRGYRIEPGEIETVLSEHPQIKEVVVILREDSPGDQRLVAYYVTEISEPPDVADLRDFLKSRLPDYMIPAAFVAIDSVPLTSHGKVDRRALPRPEYSRDDRVTEYVPPRDENERTLVTIWQEILQVENIGIDDNFFELGGHSLLATRVISRIRDQFGVELPLRHLFEYPTVAGLSAQIIAAGANLPARSGQQPIQKADRSKPLPLSFAQQRLWFLDQLRPENPFYNIPAAIRIRGMFNDEIFIRVVQEIVRRHESLRTIFQSREGQPYQVVLEHADFNIPMMDLSALDSSARESAIKQQVREHASQPFRLDTGPLFRCAVLKVAGDDHIILFTMHHIISDGWSTNILMQEVALLYNAFVNKQRPPLPGLDVQYADYAAWQRSWLKDEVLEEQLNYWKEQLGYNPPVLDLPTDYPRPALQTYNGTTLKFAIDAKIATSIRQLTQQEGCTLFMTLMAAFQCLMHRYSHQDEIFVGTPIAGRNRTELEALIGFFVNTLVIKGNFDARPSFKDFLAQIREVTLGAYAHQDLPFEYLVDALQPDRDPSHSPVFQVMFVLQNAPGQATPMPGMHMEVLEAETQTAKFDLTLMILESDQGFMAEFEYNTDLFKPSTIAAMRDHFITLLHQLTTHPQKPIDSLPLINEEEEKRIRTVWNRAPVSFPDQVSIHQLFEDRVKKTPQATAIDYNGREMSFAELNSKANQLAHYLIKKGLPAETFVGISLERGPEMVIALLGVLKAGGVYVPIDPAYPAERITYILEDAGIDLLLTRNHLVQQFAAHQQVECLSLDTDWLLISAESDQNPGRRVHPEQLAYMIYTSGSTGRPKGTMLQHRGLCNLTMFQIKDFQLQENDRCLQFASFSFDASVSEIFTTLISGATLCLADREQILPGPELLRYLEQNRITHITLPPSVSSLLKGHPLPHLKTLVSAGEACTREIAEYWHKDRHFINAYGPTENTVCASSYAVTALDDSALIPIGRAIDNVQIYILDAQGNLLPPGIPGELCIAGVNLARGYYHQPGLTAEKFVPDPFSSERGARLYRSGDLARYRHDGNIEFLGRIDQQVKIRGIRIELGEIENILIQHEAVHSCVVIDREDTPGDIRLVAYIIARVDTESEPESLRQWLKKRLPDYMIPAAFVTLESIPLTPNGKIDRRRLPRPKYERADRDIPYVAPRTPEEEQLWEIWKSLLPAEHIGVMDNFFELGGHSLLATQLVSRIRDRFQLEIPLMALFENPTISGLTLEINKAQWQQMDRALPPLKRADRSGDIPLSFAQQRLWFLDQLAPNNPAYNIPTALRFKGRIDVNAFRNSLQAIVERHESLRTTFKSVNGMPVQVIHDDASAEADWIDIRDLPEEQREAEMKRLVTEDLLDPFDLEVGPLFRVKIIRMTDDDQVVLFNMHHIISDGWSMGILIREFTSMYTSYTSNAIPARLPQLVFQYADFSVWQRTWLNTEMLDEQIRYWKNRIGINPPPLNLPLDHPRPAIQSYRGSSVSIILNKELSEAIKESSHRQGVTLFMFLCAAFQTLLHRYARQNEVIIGTPIANRTQSELESIIGFFVNNLVLKTDFGDDPSLNTLLQRVKEITLEAYAHQHLPFEQLVEILQPQREMSHAPIFQVVFVMQNTPLQAMQLPGLQIEAVQAEQKIAKFDLTLIMMDSLEGLYAELEYNTDLFEESTMLSMLNHYRHVLEAFVEHPEMNISRIPLRPVHETRHMLQAWNQTASDFRIFSGIHQFFEQTAGRMDTKTAVIGEKGRISYRELNRRANQVAHYLRGQGIGPEQIVAISMQRSLDLIVAILGVLKSGAAYLPIDPDYPQQRIEYIIRDSGIQWLISHSDLKALFPFKRISCLWIDELSGRLKNLPEDNPAHITVPENLAYVIYTSGSTGHPKGTLLQHSGLINLVQALSQIYRVNQESKTLQFAAFGFDASVEEIFTTLTAGGTLVLISRERLLSGSGLIDVLKKEKITNVTLPPSVLNLLAGHQLPHLRSLVSAGEACSVTIANYWSQHQHFVNGYGPTENTVCSTTFEVSQPITGSTVPIGKPIPNTQAYIVDEHFNPLPPGIPGELCLSGMGLARGYLNRPDWTAEKFIPHPLAEQPGQRLYRTGDLARYREDGHIEFLGRVDEQVKIRGFRIEPGEIESLIRQVEAVKDVVVAKKETPEGEAILVAYLVVVNQASFPLNDLKEHLRQKLSDYMLPAAYVFIDTLPLTPHGKIDYRALPEPDLLMTPAESEITLPRNGTEVRIQQIWQKVLKRPSIGVTTSFFDLGGHSLLAMKLLAEIEQDMGQDINLVEFFREPTIEHMARLVSGETGRKSTLQLISLRKGSDKQALYFVHPSGGGVHHYAELAELLETERAFYGIQAKGLDGKEALHQTIPEMAAAYIDLVLKNQPRGEYIIGSWSLGVIIAHEMARQLNLMGKKVALLLQFDQGPYIDYEPPADTAEMLANMFVRYFKIDPDYLRSLDEEEQFKVVIKKAKKHRVIPKFVRLADFKRYILVNETQIMAWKNYQIEPYPGKMILFRSEENKGVHDPSLGWKNWVNEIEIIDVPGNHITMIQKPHVQELARKLSKTLHTNDIF